MDQLKKAGPQAPAGIEQAKRWSTEEVARAFQVPVELLVEPGHVMKREKFEQMLEQQQK